MKPQKVIGNICLGFMALSSFSALAQKAPLRTFEIENLTYPEHKMTVECENQSCSLMKFTVEKAGSYESYYSVNRDIVEDTSSNRRRRGSSARVYSLTSDSADLAATRYDEGYYGQAIGNGIVTGLAAIIDTVALPVNIIESLVDRNAIDSRQDKVGARRILGNLNSDIQKVVIKHKFYEQIENYVTSSFPYAQTDEEYELLADFNLGVFENCSLQAHYDSKYHTYIYVDGHPYKHKSHTRDGGYEKTSDLVKTLEYLVREERCVQPGKGGKVAKADK